MGDVTVAAIGLLPKIASLFNNALYSDIQFIFKDKNGRNEVGRMYGHKLILSLRSDFFAVMFKKDSSLHTIDLSASEQSLFYLLFKFLYTDNVQFHTFDEAQDLYDLANAYAVPELIEKCNTYLMQDKLTIQNIFSRYERALKKSNTKLVKDCQDFACSATQQILKSEGFSHASSSVVEDIVKLDNLFLSSELQIINAVLDWGVQSLIEKKLPCEEKHLRESIQPFLKHLRILTLTPSEFKNFVKKYNIFNGSEIVMLTQKIVLPEDDVEVPEGFSSITVKRGSLVLKDAKFFADLGYVTKDLLPRKSLLPTPVVSETGNQQYGIRNLALTDTLISTPVVSEIKNQQHGINKLVFTEPLLSTAEMSQHQQYGINNLVLTESVLPTPAASETKNIKYNVKRFSVKDSNGSSSKSKQKFKSSPDTRSTFKSPFPVYNLQNQVRNFLFPLTEGEHRSISSAFRSDINCSVAFKMKRGNLKLCGLELKVKNVGGVADNLQLSVELQGFSNLPFYETYMEKLCNSIITIKFSEVMVLKEGKKGMLEVEIDNLALDRCSICSCDQPYELNEGLDFGCEFIIKSNRKNNSGSGTLFLINKLIYLRM